MAELYNKQAKLYAESRPSYPSELFQFIASKTANHDLAWDAGTGSGQAAVSLAGIYKRVVATDTSIEQLTFARQLPNIHYVRTPPNMSLPDLTRVFSAPASVDLVTAATALHWFDIPSFFEHVKWVLRRPDGVFAAWCYTEPLVNESIDAIYSRLYNIDSTPFWHPGRKLLDKEYRDMDFPFEPVEGEDHTGPFRFEAKTLMNLDTFLTYIRSWSGYQTAREKGVELLSEEVVRDLEQAWGENGSSVKTVTFPIHLRIGRVAN